jgi:hypothetical protein
MGAWGTGSFDNDDALDLVTELERDGHVAIQTALENVIGLGAREYLQAPAASAAIAASEIIAAARDRDVVRLPEDARRWVDIQGDSVATTPLVEQARRALERILLRSELKDLWEEGHDDAQFHSWERGVRQLMTRLVEPAPTAIVQAPKAPMLRKVTLEPGDIVSVDLDRDWHTYARILARPTKIAFYDHRVRTPDKNLVAIVKAPVLFVLAVNDRVKKGCWPKIGHLPLEIAPVPIPDQFMQDVGTGVCEIVDEAFNSRAAMPEECVGLERVAVWDPVHVEERIRDHYAGRPNAQADNMKVKLSARG